MSLTPRMTRVIVALGMAAVTVAAQQAPAAQPPLATAIDQLVSFDFPVRTNAARIGFTPKPSNKSPIAMEPMMTA